MENEVRYKQFKVSLNPATATAFKNACMMNNVSMASVISRFMADYTKIKAEEKNRNNPNDYSTKRRRRAAVVKIVKQLEQVRDCEQEYIDRILENLQTSSVYEKAEEFLSGLETAIEELENIAFA
jgi:hypothetical protein